MSGLFGSKKQSYPEPEPPATMPDPEDPLAKRQRRRTHSLAPAGSGSAATDRLAPVPGTIGREFSRGTLGAS